MASDIHGTFTWVKTLMKDGQGYGHGPGGAVVATDSSGRTWISWHVWDVNKVSPATPGARISKVAELRWVTVSQWFERRTSVPPAAFVAGVGFFLAFWALVAVSSPDQRTGPPSAATDVRGLAT